MLCGGCGCAAAAAAAAAATCTLAATLAAASQRRQGAAGRSRAVRGEVCRAYDCRPANLVVVALFT
eukprot:COSAG01_NODE_6427_length_3673_cov_69.208170_5_plen_66_part_00